MTLQAAMTASNRPAYNATSLEDLPRALRPYLRQAVLHAYLRNQDRTGIRAHWHSFRAGFLVGWIQLNASRAYGRPVFVDDLAQCLLKDLVKQERDNEKE